jgi:hypothetical protein
MQLRQIDCFNAGVRLRLASTANKPKPENEMNMPGEFTTHMSITADTNNPRIGSDFEDFFKEQAQLEASTAVAMKRVSTWEQLTAQAKIAQERNEQRV